jgi:hypothetical protein
MRCNIRKQDKFISRRLHIVLRPWCASVYPRSRFAAMPYAWSLQKGGPRTQAPDREQCSTSKIRARRGPFWRARRFKSRNRRDHTVHPSGRLNSCLRRRRKKTPSPQFERLLFRASPAPSVVYFNAATAESCSTVAVSANNLVRKCATTRSTISESRVVGRKPVSASSFSSDGMRRSISSKPGSYA